MMDEKLIGVLVWGVRNGFRNNWLSHNVDASVMEGLNDEMRQICNSTVEPFYSVEIIAKRSVITIYNPNAIDHVQRRAYIALSVVVPLGAVFGNLKSALDEMLMFYKQRQANAMANMITAQQLLDIVIKTGQPRPANQGSLLLGNKLGHYQYAKSEDLVPILNQPSFSGYKKVFFDDGNNLALKQIPGISAVQSFKKTFQVQIIGQFDPNRFVIKRNGNAVTGSQFLAVDGDIVEVLESKANRRRQYPVSGCDLRIPLAVDFPQAPLKPPQPPGGNGKLPGPKPPSPPHVPAWFIVLIFFVILSAGIAGVTYSDQIIALFQKKNSIGPGSDSSKVVELVRDPATIERDSLIDNLANQYNPININIPKSKITYKGYIKEKDTALLVYYYNGKIDSFSIQGKFKLKDDKKFKEFGADDGYVTQANRDFLKWSKLDKEIPDSLTPKKNKKNPIDLYIEDNPKPFPLNVLYVNLRPTSPTPRPATSDIPTAPEGSNKSKTGPNNQGPNNQGPNNQGPNKNGPNNQGPNNQGIENQGGNDELTKGKKRKFNNRRLPKHEENE